MTKHEAVEILEEVRTLDDSMFAYDHAYNEALDMAIEVLKAQEPKRVSVVNNGFTGLPVTHCPKCHTPIDMFYGAHGAETEFCPWCGQAVKWE